MAVFARDSRFKGLRRQLPLRESASGVATKTVISILGSEFSPYGLLQRLRRDARVPRSNFEAINRGVIAHQTLEVNAVSLKYPSLSAFAEIPANGKRDRPRPVTHRIRALTILRFHSVTKTKFLEGEPGPG